MLAFFGLVNKQIYVNTNYSNFNKYMLIRYKVRARYVNSMVKLVCNINTCTLSLD